MLKLKADVNTVQKAVESFSSIPPYEYHPPPGLWERWRNKVWVIVPDVKLIVFAVMNGIVVMALQQSNAPQPALVYGKTLAQLLIFFAPQADQATQLMLAPLVAFALTVFLIHPIVVGLKASNSEI